MPENASQYESCLSVLNEALVDNRLLNLMRIAVVKDPQQFLKSPQDDNNTLISTKLHHILTLTFKNYRDKQKIVEALFEACRDQDDTDVHSLQRLNEIVNIY